MRGLPIQESIGRRYNLQRYTFFFMFFIFIRKIKKKNYKMLIIS